MQKNTDTKPRYLVLREQLEQDIAKGVYPVGSVFPTEGQLGLSYQVSRHTVREATRTLVERGLIAKRAGFGTVVCAKQAAAPYIAALGTVDELFKYTQATRLELLDQKWMSADMAMAMNLDCERDSQWLVLNTQRLTLDNATAISFTQIYLRPEFAAIADQLHGQHKSIFKMLEEDHQQHIAQIQQDIEAKLMPLKAAKLLDVPKNSPALHVRRAYLDAKGRLLAVSSNLYAASRFRLKTTWLLPATPRKKKPSQR
jgi:DNA-binding GntR family transcriptional regulator